MAMSWDEVAEMQPDVITYIKNSFQKERVAHAYLFEGMHGTGKRDTAILLAKALFCENLHERYKPCESCLNCKRITSGNHPDLHLVEPDGLSIKKQQIKDLQEEFSKKGMESSRKVYMVIDAEKMSVSAANSLLKFLEEPGADTVAILLTENPQRILPTILSRCQIIAFHPLKPDFFIKKLIENGVDPNSAHLLAQMTNNVHEAMDLNVQDWFAHAQLVVVKLYEVLKKKPLEAMVALQGEWFVHFKEKEQIDRGLDLLLLVFRDLLYIQLGKQEQIVFRREAARLQQLALHTRMSSLPDQMAAVLEAKRKLQANMNPQLLMEQLVLKLQEGSAFV
ncbi:DNA polymerase III subunit delta' [Bacillus sp. EB01]|uniref:DNA polymerase III subunit delta' n=1 Tax=Bacillus sp. EB01 TaxID=1347086 RepID=UPI000B2BEC0B|nr:DNA polymerase III subunit delta' [Bacillus sp. EB01]